MQRSCHTAHKTVVWQVSGLIKRSITLWLHVWDMFYVLAKKTHTLVLLLKLLLLTTIHCHYKYCQKLGHITTQTQQEQCSQAWQYTCSFCKYKTNTIYKNMHHINARQTYHLRRTDLQFSPALLSAFSLQVSQMTSLVTTESPAATAGSC